jgi:hypothetical protein
MIERRNESRFLCADLVKIEWLTDNFSGGDLENTASEKRGLRGAEAVLEDISSLGACVQVDEVIPPGVPILISVIGEQCARRAGQVTYCVYRDYGYFVGIRFAEETRWSSGVFEPQHLISLEELVMHQPH